MYKVDYEMLLDVEYRLHLILAFLVFRLQRLQLILHLVRLLLSCLMIRLFSTPPAMSAIPPYSKPC